ncbi:MAG: BatD family protein [Gemmatimonadaceae bacterium]
MIGAVLALFAQLSAAQRFPQDCPTRLSSPAIVSRARIEPGSDVTFRAMAIPDTVYVGQQSEYQVAVFLGGEVRDRLRRNPTFFPPDMPGMLAYDLPIPAGDAPQRFANHRCYDVLVYRRAIFPLLPGRIAIPPAQLVYSLSLSLGFFSREESREVRTDSAVVVAVDLPLQGRPGDYAGAVGQLGISSTLDGRDARVGDPVMLTVRVEGKGNVKLFPRPALLVPWATLVATTERVRIDSASAPIRGVKEFDWLLTPQEPGTREVPAVRYPYFDPDLRRYQVAESPALTLAVTGASRASVAAGDPAHAEPALAIRARDRGPVPPPVHDHPLFWAAALLAPLPALARAWRGRRRSAPRRPPPAAVMRRSIARGEGAAPLRRAWLAALAGRLGLPVLDITEPRNLRRALLRAGVRPATADRARDLLLALDAAAYDRTGTVVAPGGADVAAAYDAVDAEAIAPARVSPPPGRVPPGAMLLFLLVLPALAMHAGPAATFAEGVQAYHRADYRAAVVSFARATDAEPRSVDAWANYGTAAWASADTIAATHGWARAVRLEPSAADVRDHLERVDVAGVRDPAFVPPVSSSSLAITALLLWWGGWIARARRGRLRGSETPVSASLLAAAAFLAAATALLVERTDPAHLAIVRASSPLTSTPESGGEQMARVEKGAVVRLAGQAGGYVRVSAAGEREGWIEGSRLLRMDAAAEP